MRPKNLYLKLPTWFRWSVSGRWSVCIWRDFHCEALGHSVFLLIPYGPLPGPFLNSSWIWQLCVHWLIQTISMEQAFHRHFILCDWGTVLHRVRVQGSNPSPPLASWGTLQESPDLTGACVPQSYCRGHYMLLSTAVRIENIYARWLASSSITKIMSPANIVLIYIFILC